MPGSVHERTDVCFSSPSYVDHKKTWTRTIMIVINNSNDRII